LNDNIGHALFPPEHSPLLFPDFFDVHPTLILPSPSPQQPVTFCFFFFFNQNLAIGRSFSLDTALHKLHWAAPFPFWVLFAS